MVWPGRSVNTRLQLLIAFDEVFVMVMLSVRPVFQPLTASATLQPPGGGGGLDDEELDDEELDEEDEELDDVLLWNWVKKFHTTPEVQVCQPSQVQPSIGPGSWPAPSKAAQVTGYPGLQPE